jgi:hypothetical protein
VGHTFPSMFWAWYSLSTPSMVAPPGRISHLREDQECLSNESVRLGVRTAHAGLAAYGRFEARAVSRVPAEVCEWSSTRPAVAAKLPFRLHVRRHSPVCWARGIVCIRTIRMNGSSPGPKVVQQLCQPQPKSLEGGIRTTHTFRIR